jgi:hypothetical protein
MSLSDGKEVLVAAVDTMYVDHAEAVATARLIAAAPELLRAVQLIMALDKAGPSGSIYYVRLDPKAKEQLERAIAKATGHDQAEST